MYLLLAIAQIEQLGTDGRQSLRANKHESTLKIGKCSVIKTGFTVLRQADLWHHFSFLKFGFSLPKTTLLFYIIPSVYRSRVAHSQKVYYIIPF